MCCRILQEPLNHALRNLFLFGQRWLPNISEKGVICGIFFLLVLKISWFVHFELGKICSDITIELFRPWNFPKVLRVPSTRVPLKVRVPKFNPMVNMQQWWQLNQGYILKKGGTNERNKNQNRKSFYCTSAEWGTGKKSCIKQFMSFLHSYGWQRQQWHFYNILVYTKI